MYLEFSTHLVGFQCDAKDICYHLSSFFDLPFIACFLLTLVLLHFLMVMYTGFDCT